MGKRIGLWIDHRQAVMVFLAGGKEEIKRVESNVRKDVRPSGGSRSKTPYGPQDVFAEVKRERQFVASLNRYYDDVITHFREADSILILGPGKAKEELKKRMERKGLGGRIVGTETVDKMTERQIAAKVRKHFIQ